MNLPPDSGMTSTVSRLRAAGCVFAEDEAAVLYSSAEDCEQLETMILARVDGVPLESIVGWAEFCGLRVQVRPGVFVPRRRSGYLVRLALKQVSAASNQVPDRSLHPSSDPVVVLDLCCGSGALGMAVAAGMKPRHVELHATDIHEAAVQSAHENLDALGGNVYTGDLFDPLPASLRGRVDLMLVNAPYVPTSQIELMPREARLYEPAVTLDGGIDGAQVHRRLAAQAPQWLASTGILLIETGRLQANQTARAVTSSGLRATVRHSSKWNCTVVLGIR